MTDRRNDAKDKWTNHDHPPNNQPTDRQTDRNVWNARSKINDEILSA